MVCQHIVECIRQPIPGTRSNCNVRPLSLSHIHPTNLSPSCHDYSSCLSPKHQVYTANNHLLWLSLDVLYPWTWSPTLTILRAAEYRKEMHFERRSGTPASATPPLANEHVSFVDASEIGVVLREHGRCADTGIGRSEHL